MPRLNVANAKQSGFSDEQIAEYLAQRPDVVAYTPDNIPQAPQQEGGLSEFLPTAGAVAGSFTPLGPIFGGAAGAGVGTLLKQLIQRKNLDVGEVGKEAALGGVGGVVGKGIGKVAGKFLPKAAQAGAAATEEVAPGGLKGMGQALRKGVVQPKVAPTATAAGEEANLLEQGRALGLKGPAESQRIQSNAEYKRIVGEIQNRLATNNPSVDPAFSKTSVKQAIAGTLNYDPKLGTWNRALKLRMGQVADKKNVQQLLQYKLDLGDKLGRAFKKIELGADLTVQEEAALATWQSIDRIIGQVAPELNDATRAMSVLHRLAPGLKKSAEEGIRLPIVGKVPGVTPLVQGAQDLAGRTLEGVGSSAIPGMTGKIAGTTALQSGTRALLDQPQVQEEPTESDIPMEGTALSDFGGAKDEDIKQAFMLSMLANPKQASTLKTIYEFGFAGKDGKPKTVTAAQRGDLAKAGKRGLATVKQELKKDPNVVVKQLIPGTYLSRQFDSGLFRTIEALLRLRTGAAAPESEVRRYMKQIGPRFGDSPEVIQTKLNDLEAAFNDALESSTGVSTPSLQDFGGSDQSSSLFGF